MVYFEVAIWVALIASLGCCVVSHFRKQQLRADLNAEKEKNAALCRDMEEERKRNDEIKADLDAIIGFHGEMND